MRSQSPFLIPFLLLPLSILALPLPIPLETQTQTQNPDAINTVTIPGNKANILGDSTKTRRAVNFVPIKNIETVVKNGDDPPATDLVTDGDSVFHPYVPTPLKRRGLFDFAPDINPFSTLPAAENSAPKIILVDTTDPKWKYIQQQNPDAMLIDEVSKEVVEPKEGTFWDAPVEDGPGLLEGFGWGQGRWWNK